MDKLKMHSPDLPQDNIARIRDLFPGCVTEAKGEDGKLKLAVDFDQLRQELSDSIVEGPQERYHLNWPGKREALLTANAPIAKTLRPCREESVDFDTTKNLFIEGDNLEALKLLQETYLGKVKMIYIDPPYNTGNDFIYEDDFSENTGEYLRRSNQVDEEGNRLVANTAANGRFHSDWLSMLYPRLKLARNLLREDGAVFVQIDETEVSNLQKICDEIFGSDNFVNLITVKTKMAGVSGANLGGSLQNSTEQILWYAKSKDDFSLHHIPAKKQELLDYIEVMKISGRSWKYTQVLVSPGVESLVTSFKDGAGQSIEVYEHKNPVIKSISTIAKEQFSGNIKNAYYGYVDRVFRTTNAQSSIRQKLLDLGNVSSEDLISIKYVPQKGKNAGQSAQLFYRGPSKELFAWLGDIVQRDGDQIVKLDNKGNLWDDIQYNNLTKEGDIAFPNGKKPIQIMMDLQRLCCERDDLIVDFFAGSASTAHAVMQLNATDNGERRFVMVQLPAPVSEEAEAFKEGLQTIAEIGKERIRRAGSKIKEESPLTRANVDIGFRVLKIDTSNMADVYYTPDALPQGGLFDMVDNIKPDRTSEDLLFQVMLDWGVDLALPIEKKTIQGKEVFFVDGDVLAACFDADGGIDEDFVKELAKTKPLRVVFRDAGFKGDDVKINVEQIFKLLSPATDVKCL